MKEESPVLRENWHEAEYIDEKGNYVKAKWRTIERIGFYIRPIQKWFFPCRDDQLEIKKLFLDSAWILGNKDYEPQIEMQRALKEIDDDSWQILEKRKPTDDEKKRMKEGKWYDL